MKKIALITLFLLLINAMVPVSIFGYYKQTSDIKPFLEQRFHVYTKYGSTAFLKELIKGGKLNFSDVQTQIDLSNFKKADNFYVCGS